MLPDAVFRFGGREPAARVWALWIHSVVSRAARSLPKRASCDVRRRPPSDTRGRCLRNRGMLGLKFRRQHVVRGFIVDFYCAAERLVLELEGAPHAGNERRAYDAARAATLEAAGYRVIRIANRDVTRDHLEGLLSRAFGRSRLVPPLPQGEGDRG